MNNDIDGQFCLIIQSICVMVWCIFGVNFVDGRNKNGTWDRELAIKLVHSRRLVDLLVASLFVIESRPISAYLLFTAAESQRCVVKKSKGKSYVAFI